MGDSDFRLPERALGNQDSCSVAGRRPSQRTPRWTAAIHRKPSSPAVLGTTRLRSWGPRTVQGVPGLSSLQGVSRGGFPRLFQLLGAPGIRPWAGGHPAPVSASIRKRLYPTYVPVYKQFRTAAPWAVGTTLSKLGSVLPSSLPLRESPGSTRGQALRFQTWALILILPFITFNLGQMTYFLLASVSSFIIGHSQSFIGQILVRTKWLMMQNVCLTPCS